jgi:chromosome partitioning protein
MKTIAFFNNKGGVGKTSLVYHLALMFAERGVKTLAVDLDPQSNLTSMFLDEEKLDQLWNGDKNATIFHSLQAIIKGTGDILPAHIEPIHENLGLIAGNLALSRFEDSLSEKWPKCLSGDEAAFRVITAFYRIILAGAHELNAEIVLIDVGPNLGAINRSALIASQQVVLPMAPDLFSLQGLRNLGPTLRDWRKEWQDRLSRKPENLDIALPKGEMKPMGYVVMQHSMQKSRPVKAYIRWLDRIPEEYQKSVLNSLVENALTVEKDPHCLALLRHYRSLMPLAMEARKPMFSLKSADGAIGAHLDAVAKCYSDFLDLAKRIAHEANIELT